MVNNWLSIHLTNLILCSLWTWRKSLTKSSPTCLNPIRNNSEPCATIVESKTLNLKMRISTTFIASSSARCLQLVSTAHALWRFPNSTSITCKSVSWKISSRTAIIVLMLSFCKRRRIIIKSVSKNWWLSVLSASKNYRANSRSSSIYWRMVVLIIWEID